MSFKSTFLLFGLLIGALWVFGLTLSLRKGVADEGYVLPTLHEEQGVTIDGIEINRGGKKYAFVRGGTGWKLTLPPSKQEVRVEEFKVDRIIDQVKDARKNDEADVTRNLEKFGLAPPIGTVTLKKKGGGKDWTLNLGNESPDKSFVYVNSSDRPKEVMAVRASALESVFFKDTSDLRTRTLLDVTDMNAQAVQLKEPKGKDGKAALVSLKKTEQGGWRFEEPSYGAADFEGSASGKQKHEGVKDLLNAIGGLRVDDFEPLGSTRAMKDYGLEDGQEKLRIQVASAGGFGGQKGTTAQALLVGDKAKDKDQYYVRLEGEQTVARVDAKKLEPILKVISDPKSLRSYDLTQLDPTSPDAIDLLYGKELVKLRRPEPTLWKIFTGTDIPRKADTTAIEGDKGLVAALQGKRQIKEFFDANGPEDVKKLEAKLGLDTPAAEVKVWVGGLVKEEPKETKKVDLKDKDAKKDKKEPEVEPKLKADAKPAVTLRFGKAEKGLVNVKREAADGSVSWMAVPIDILQKVAPANGALAFLDPIVPGFTVLDATKLDLVRGVEKFEAVREKEPKQAEWTLNEPKDLPKRTAADAGEVDKVLDGLANLTAKKWVKKVDPKDAKALAPFGLDTPPLTVTVTIKKMGDDKGEPHVYKFGKETDVAADKPGVYALQGNSDLVFLVDPGLVKTLREAELRDRTVFKFDPEKIKEIKLALRKEGEGVRSPVFERKAETKAWVIKSGLEEFSLDEAKVDDLARLLSGLHAERYVSFKGAPKPEFKLGEKEAGLRIEVVMDDGAKHELTVGAAKDRIGYYAQSNSLPGVVFLVAHDRFTPLLGGVSYFSKNRAAE